MKGSISSVNFASVTSQKALMPALSIIECHVEPHFFRFPVKVKKTFVRCPSHACVETHVGHVRAGMVCGYKTMMMMMTTFKLSSCL